MTYPVISTWSPHDINMISTKSRRSRQLDRPSTREFGTPLANRWWQHHRSICETYHLGMVYGIGFTTWMNLWFMMDITTQKSWSITKHRIGTMVDIELMVAIFLWFVLWAYIIRNQSLSRQSSHWGFTFFFFKQENIWKPFSRCQGSISLRSGFQWSMVGQFIVVSVSTMVSRGMFNMKNW